MDKQQIGDRAISILGGGIGAGLGLVGGPAGTIAGAMLGTAITETLRDVAKRMLSNKEALRVDNTSNYIAEGIIAKWSAGESVRQDDFFQGDANFTSNGAELLEGILLKCKEQYQERKLRFISNIFKNVAFDVRISATAAYQTLSLAENLTYQKFCLLSYYGKKEVFANFNIMKDPTLWYSKVVFPVEMLICLQDILEMVNQGILANNTLMTDSTHLSPNGMDLTAKGQKAFDLMELQHIPDSDVLEAIAPLEYQHSWGISDNNTLNGEHQKSQ